MVVAAIKSHGSYTVAGRVLEHDRPPIPNQRERRNTGTNHPTTFLESTVSCAYLGGSKSQGPEIDPKW